MLTHDITVPESTAVTKSYLTYTCSLENKSSQTTYSAKTNSTNQLVKEGKGGRHGLSSIWDSHFN